MTNRPTDRPGSAGATGRRSYPESEVSHGGARYRLERSPDGAKRLVVEAADEARPERLLRSAGDRRRGHPARRTDDGGERGGAAQGAALADADPLRPAHLGRVRRPAGAVHARSRPGAAYRRRADPTGVRAAVHPRDGPMPPDAAQRARRRDLGRLPGRLDRPGRWRRGPSGGAGGHRRHRGRRVRLLHARPEGRAWIPRPSTRTGGDPAEGRGPRLGRPGVRPRGDSPGATSGSTSSWSTSAVELDEESVLRALAKYGPSLAHAMAMYRRLMEKGIDCEVEFAVDETDYPTKPAEHVRGGPGAAAPGDGVRLVRAAFRRTLREGDRAHRRPRRAAARLRGPRADRACARPVQAVPALRLRQVLDLSAGSRRRPRAWCTSRRPAPAGRRRCASSPRTIPT